MRVFVYDSGRIGPRSGLVRRVASDLFVSIGPRNDRNYRQIVVAPTRRRLGATVGRKRQQDNRRHAAAHGRQSGTNNRRSTLGTRASSVNGDRAVDGTFLGFYDLVERNTGKKSMNKN